MFNITVHEFHGKPINAEDRKAVKELLSKSMETLEAELGPCKPDNAVEFQSRLKEMVDSEVESYPISKEFAFNSEEGLKAILSGLGGTLTFCLEEGNIVGYVVAEDL